MTTAPKKLKRIDPSRFAFSTGEGTKRHIVRKGRSWTWRGVSIPPQMLRLDGSNAMPRASKQLASTKKRLPITITLLPEHYAFVEACAHSRAFGSLDEFFEAAISIFQTHKESMRAYIVEQEVMGVPRNDIKRNVECNIVYRTKIKRDRRPIDRTTKSARTRQ
jgi:hypothetical protein